MQRRKFFGLTIAGLIGSALTKFPIIAQTTQRIPGLSIAQIVAVAYPAVLNEMRQGRTFVDYRLEQALQSKQILVTTLGATVETEPFKYRNGVIVRGTSHDVKQVSIPAIWTPDDDLKNPRESEKIHFAGKMIENLINSHDHLLLEQLAGHRLVISKYFLYDRGDVMEMPNHRGHFMHIYTAYAQIPLKA